MAPRPLKYLESYGMYWEGTLSNFDVTSANGWYDIRTTLTDAAGNKQVQTITPAIYINSLLTGGITDILNPTITLSVCNGKIVSSTDAEVNVYTLTGAKIQNSNLPRGIYIATCANISSKILVK